MDPPCLGSSMRQSGKSGPVADAANFDEFCATWRALIQAVFATLRPSAQGVIKELQVRSHTLLLQVLLAEKTHPSTQSTAVSNSQFQAR